MEVQDGNHGGPRAECFALIPDSERICDLIALRPLPMVSTILLPLCLDQHPQFVLSIRLLFAAQLTMPKCRLLTRCGEARSCSRSPRTMQLHRGKVRGLWRLGVSWLQGWQMRCCGRAEPYLRRTQK
jgi:hypothetical protein